MSHVGPVGPVVRHAKGKLTLGALSAFPNRCARPLFRAWQEVYIGRTVRARRCARPAFRAASQPPCVGSPRRLAEVSCPGQLQERWSAACHVHTTTPGRRIAWPVSRLVRTSVRGTGCVRAASRVPGDAGVASVVAECLVVRNAVRDPWPARRARMLYVLRRQEHVSVRMCASGVGEVASSPYTFVVGPGARWRPRCTRVDGGCLRRPTPRRLVFAWRSEARRLLDERERAIEPRLSFCCCRILFCWCWAFTRGGS